MIAVELALALHQAFDDADEIAAHGAADAAIVHFEDFFVGADDEIIVDADLAEFIDDDGEFLAVGLAQDAVQERRLAGAEIAGEHGDGDFVTTSAVSERGATPADFRKACPGPWPKGAGRSYVRRRPRLTANPHYAAAGLHGTLRTNHQLKEDNVPRTLSAVIQKPSPAINVIKTGRQ